MTLRLLISLSLLLAWQAARAQSAADFFHAGARFYISNNIPGALEEVENGLKLYPDDIKLKKLKELLKQQSQQQSQQQNQQQQNQQNQSQQSQKNQQSKSQQQNSAEQNQSQKQDQPQPQNQSRQNSQQEKNEQQSQATAGQMTPQEAQRLLDSQKNDELMLPVSRIEKNPAAQQRPLKDW